MFSSEFSQILEYYVSFTTYLNEIELLMQVTNQLIEALRDSFKTLNRQVVDLRLQILNAKNDISSTKRQAKQGEIIAGARIRS